MFIKQNTEISKIYINYINSRAYYITLLKVRFLNFNINFNFNTIYMIK